MYDAIVVGARCGGSPTAMLLARAGYRVLLVDKATFPSDIMSTHYIQPPGIARMARWGLVDRLREADTPSITKVTLNMNGLIFSPPPPAGQDSPPEAFCPRRFVLDKILVDAAREAGAEVREGFSVREITMEGDRVTGIRGQSGGESVSEEGRIVIGADGMHSLVAKTVGADEYDTIPSLSYGYYAYWSGMQLEGAELSFLPGGGTLAFPTNDGLTCLGVGGAIDDFHRFREDVEGNYMAVVNANPRYAEFVEDGAKRETKFVGTADQPNFFRKPYGPGWALVGDAGYHRDFVTGLGITDAFRDADLLAAAIDAGFAGRQPLEEALAHYESERNEIAKPLYDFTTSLARLDGPPSLELFATFGGAMQRT